MASGSYNLSKNTVQSFFQKRLVDTFGKKVALVPGRVVGNDENPRFTLLVDNAELSRLRKTGGVGHKDVPLPICFLIGFTTDGNGGGRIEVSFYREHLRGASSYDNSNANLRKWGFSTPDDGKIAILTKRPFAISEFDAEKPSIDALNKLRNIVSGIAGYKVTTK